MSVQDRAGEVKAPGSLCASHEIKYKSSPLYIIHRHIPTLLAFFPPPSSVPRHLLLPLPLSVEDYLSCRQHTGTTAASVPGFEEKVRDTFWKRCWT